MTALESLAGRAPAQGERRWCAIYIELASRPWMTSPLIFGRSAPAHRQARRALKVACDWIETMRRIDRLAET